MNFLMIFKVALLAIARNKTRSLLTCLGIIVGIAAVIAVLAIGKGASTMMVKEISSMGNNLVMVFPDRGRRDAVSSGMGQGQTMTADDAKAIKRELSHLVSSVSPTVNVTCQMIYQGKNWQSRVTGVSTDMPDIRNWSVDEGRFFSEEEERTYQRVCVIGTTVKANLFGEDDPLGRTIRIKDMPFKVVGVLESKGANGWGQDQDDTVMAPYTTVGRVLQRSTFKSINMMNLSLYSRICCRLAAYRSIFLNFPNINMFPSWMASPPISTLFLTSRIAILPGVCPGLSMISSGRSPRSMISPSFTGIIPDLTSDTVCCVPKA